MADAHDRSGKSPHAFMQEALGVKSRLLADRQDFVARALRAEADALASGAGLIASDVDVYFEARAAERAASAPSLRTWRK